MSGKDPKREELIAPYVRAHPEREVSEPFGAQAAQIMSMGVMIMRSKYIAWLSFIISLSAWFRDRPSVSDGNGKSPWMAIIISCSSLIVAYMSILLPVPQRQLFAKPPPPSPAPGS